MIGTVHRKLGPWIPHASAREAILRAFLTRRKLPPGRILNLSRAMLADRRTLIEEAKRRGPIFKVIWNRRLCICIMGFSLGKRFLREHDEHISVATAQLERLIPKGFLRGMDGETHRLYRGTLVRAISEEIVARNKEDLEQIVKSALKRYSQMVDETDGRPERMAWALNLISRGALIEIVFGVRPGSAQFDELERWYTEMGQDEFVWHPGPSQERSFHQISDIARRIEPETDCILDRIARAGGTPDETMFGNLIYILEVGRFDLFSLFRWIVRFAADHPEKTLRSADDAAYAGAFVSEVLRLEQAERLMRNVHDDLEFNGYFIPRGSKVRICTWESHKTSDAFLDPWQFEPERFLGRSFSTDEYAPFGVGPHACPFWSVTLATSRIFLQTLASLYTIEGLGDGPPIRNTFHWQPARTFWVRLHPRRPEASPTMSVGQSE